MSEQPLYIQLAFVTALANRGCLLMARERRASFLEGFSSSLPPSLSWTEDSIQFNLYWY